MNHVHLIDKPMVRAGKSTHVPLTKTMLDGWNPQEHQLIHDHRDGEIEHAHWAQDSQP